ncbi:MAG: 3-deoxy-8-phosphooctulonate synthase [Alphaproteobacteria bacterium]|nr:3-deoxy-8-phosphooctulonate synthase [Alphaproteobacteria bacterium]MBO7641566.1 3-deoxy-8-phosphooctulonate synthase [Alphaproteobacteria bacterium]
MKVVKAGSISIANDLPFVLIAGPCALESRDVAFRCAESLIKTTNELKIPFIFKSSFDKANRTSLNARRGVPMGEALKIFRELKEKFGCLIVTDVHESQQCAEVAEVVDVLQIPAFLCRQTDLLIAAAKTGKIVEIKKGQFLAPWDMENVYKKVTMSGNENVLLCERGTCFGYNRLVSDMRSLQIMKNFGYPVVFDATHSVQEPGGLGGASGGNRDYVESLARSAMSIGVAALYIETHFDPKNAFSDGPNMVPLHVVKDFLITMKKFDELAKSTPYQDMSC